MTEQSANSQDSGLYGWQTPPQTAQAVSEGTTEIRTTKKNVCPACGEPVQGHQAHCQACGENLVQAPKQIRCMHCHTTATSELVLCPGCGRELREAPPKLVTMGVPAVLALLLVVIVATQWARVSPIAWARTNLVRGVGLVEGISASIEPGVVIIMTPVVENFAIVAGEGAASAVLAENAASSDMQAVAMAAAVVVTPIVEPTAVQMEVASVAASESSSNEAAVAQESPIGVGGPRSTDESLAVAASEVPTVVPTVSLPETNTPLPTATPLPTNTPQPPTATLVPTVAPTTAKAGGIGAALGSAASTPTPTWTVLAASNTGNTERILATATATPTSNAAAGVVLATTPTSEAMGGMAQVAALAASDTALPTPTLMPTVATTPLPTPTATPVVYQVRSGDTMVTIASTYGVDVDELMAANDISDQDVYVIQPGQMLFIPIPTPEAVAPTVVSNSAAVRLEAPALLVPTSAATISCATGGKLIWQRVQFVKDSDKYVLHLGFINGEPSNGQENVVWILAQNSPVTQTEWELDTSLCELAPAAYAGQWRWWVEVVEEADGQTVPVSPPSEIRTFVWK